MKYRRWRTTRKIKVKVGHWAEDVYVFAENGFGPGEDIMVAIVSGDDYVADLTMEQAQYLANALLKTIETVKEKEKNNPHPRALR